jgi:hypothetical protein
MVVVYAVHVLIGHVTDKTESTTTCGACDVRRDSRPHLDPGKVSSIFHGNVVDVKIFNQVCFALVLSKATDGDAVRSSAVKALNNHLSGVGLE